MGVLPPGLRLALRAGAEAPPGALQPETASGASADLGLHGVRMA